MGCLVQCRRSDTDGSAPGDAVWLRLANIRLEFVKIINLNFTFPGDCEEIEHDVGFGFFDAGTPGMLFGHFGCAGCFRL